MRTERSPSEKGLAVRVERPLPPRRPSSEQATVADASRAKRLLGVLVGTLSQFQAQSQAAGAIEEKRRIVLERVEAKEKQEQEDAARRRRALLDEQRAAFAEVCKLQQSTAAIDAVEQWAARHRELGTFLRTRTHPQLIFMPREHTEHTLNLLKQNQAEVAGEADAAIQSIMAKINTDVEERAADWPTES